MQTNPAPHLHVNRKCAVGRKQTNSQTNNKQKHTVCINAVMYVSVTAVCLCFAWSRWSGWACGSNRRIGGSRTLEVLLTHSDLIAPPLKTFEAASRETKYVSGRKCWKSLSSSQYMLHFYHVESCQKNIFFLKEKL